MTVTPPPAVFAASRRVPDSAPRGRSGVAAHRCIPRRPSRKGGAAGSIVRYMLSVWLLGGHTLLGFPAGTFTVNAAGSLLIGILLETTNSAAAGWLLIAGFCGGFTTFSTFSADAVRLLRAGDYGPATAYIALSVAVCIAFAALGMWIGAQIARN